MTTATLDRADSKHRARRAAYRTVIERLTPPEDLKPSEWAERYRILPDTSPQPGPWRNDQTPYMVGVMDACVETGVEQVVFMKPAQAGGSEGLNNVLGYFMHQDPTEILFVQIGDKEARQYSKERIAPMIQATPELRALVGESKTRTSSNTVLEKSFPNGHLGITGANAPAGLRSRSRRVLLCDEIDGYPPSAGNEGDPIGLAEARTRNYWNKLKFYASTPTLAGLSRIETALHDCDVVRKYHVPCPHCAHEQQFVFSQLIWEKDEESGVHLPETAEYCCVGCGGLIPERHKRWMNLNGRWRDGVLGDEDDNWAWTACERPIKRPRAVGFTLNALYSPWMTWREIVEEFLEAKNDRLRLQVWVNTVLGETFKEDGAALDANPLLERRERYVADPLPEGVLLITVGVDVQADRLEAEIVGWGLEYESWSLDYLRIPGDPTLEGGVWSTLDVALARKFDHPSGLKFGVYSVAIDSSYLPQRVTRYCNDRRGANVWPIKGRAGEGRPIWDRPHTRNKYKVPLYPVGVDSAKGVVMSHLKIQLPEDEFHEGPIPGYCHFPARAPYDKEFFRQLTSEIVVVKRSPNGYHKRQWIKRPGRRNEVLDCRVYALAAREGAYLAGVRMETIAEAVRNRGTPEPTRRVRSQGVAIG